MLRIAPRLVCIALVSIAASFIFSANAQQFTQARDGVIVTSGSLTLRITALRDDVLRVRMWRGDAVPEDASWAVIPASRTSSVQVHTDSHGFTTGKLRISVDDQLRLTIADLDGNVLQKEAHQSNGTGRNLYSASSTLGTLATSQAHSIAQAKASPCGTAIPSAGKTRASPSLLS
jgi:alpha-glucosidase